ncbi:MAG: hypothetical protein HY657_07705 [Acidobacteria bacterium]|nr:hypothetical protein [Acidobacteriota bacterium]
MTPTPEIPRPSQLWKQLSSERRLQAAAAFWQDEHAGAEQAEAAAAIAQRIKFRVKSVVAMSDEKRTRHLASLPSVPELVAARLLVAYHLTHQRPMMATFLSALGIPHEDGVLADDDLQAPAPAALQSAVAALAASYPPEDVSLYLSTLTWQDPETWRALADLPETRPHLQHS